MAKRSEGWSANTSTNWSALRRATVWGGARRIGQPRGHRPEHRVAALVAPALVDVLEALEVGQHHHDQALVALGHDQRLLEALPQQLAVGQAGERVVCDLVLEVAGALVGLGHVAEHADDVRHDAVLVGHRGDAQLDVAAPPVAQLAKDDGVVAPRDDRVGQRGAAGLVEAARCQCAAVASDDIGRAQAGHALERGVDVFDRVVGHVAARDHDAAADRVQGAFAQAQLDLALVPRGLGAIGVVVRVIGRHRLLGAAGRGADAARSRFDRPRAFAFRANRLPGAAIISSHARRRHASVIFAH
nr:hypothetical protein [Massilia glaciei]